MIQIPLRNGSGNAHQRFSMRLGASFLNFEINYISYADVPAWSMDIYRDGTPMVLGTMLVPGANITSNYRSNIGNFYFVGDEPTIDNLGVNNQLVWSEA